VDGGREREREKGGMKGETKSFGSPYGTLTFEREITEGYHLDITEGYHLDM